jgi:hypothetical protein
MGRGRDLPTARHGRGAVPAAMGKRTGVRLAAPTSALFSVPGPASGEPTEEGLLGADPPQSRNASRLPGQWLPTDSK